MKVQPPPIIVIIIATSSNNNNNNASSTAQNADERPLYWYTRDAANLFGFSYDDGECMDYRTGLD